MNTIFSSQLFEGKVILITGAGGGVGRATAALLSSLGASVVLADSKPDPLCALAAQVGGFPILADLRRASECERIIAMTLEHYGQLDGLVNCAGVWVEGDSSLATEEDWARCMDVNLKGSFFMCSRAIPALKETRGAIVNISSDAGVTGNAGAAIYCASKGGVTIMSKSLAIELAPFGIRVNALCPSDIMSPMLTFQAEQFGDGNPNSYFKKLLSNYPQGDDARFIEPAEVAQYIAYLLSPAGHAVTGASVMMDFGVTSGY